MMKSVHGCACNNNSNKNIISSYSITNNDIGEKANFDKKTPEISHQEVVFENRPRD